MISLSFYKYREDKLNDMRLITALVTFVLLARRYGELTPYPLLQSKYVNGMSNRGSIVDARYTLSKDIRKGIQTAIIVSYQCQSTCSCGNSRNCLLQTRPDQKS